jgi:hypothetical protein
MEMDLSDEVVFQFIAPFCEDCREDVPVSAVVEWQGKQLCLPCWSKRSRQARGRIEFLLERAKTQPERRGIWYALAAEHMTAGQSSKMGENHAE